MKRTDLTEDLLTQEMNSLAKSIAFNITDLSDLLSIAMPHIDLASIPIHINEVEKIWRYASAILTTQIPTEFSGSHLNEDVQILLKALFTPSISRMPMHVPKEFWHTPIGYACEVTLARNQLDNFFPIGTTQLALLSDRMHTTIQQHCQSGKIIAVRETKGVKSWEIPPVSALEYLIEIESKPFSEYPIQAYKEQLAVWLNSGIGQKIRDEDKERYYSMLTS